jgi:esterase/lipase
LKKNKTENVVEEVNTPIGLYNNILHYTTSPSKMVSNMWNAMVDVDDEFDTTDEIDKTKQKLKFKDDSENEIDTIIKQYDELKNVKNKRAKEMKKIKKDINNINKIQQPGLTLSGQRSQPKPISARKKNK